MIDSFIIRCRELYTPSALMAPPCSFSHIHRSMLLLYTSAQHKTLSLSLSLSPKQKINYYSASKVYYTACLLSTYTTDRDGEGGNDKYFMYINVYKKKKKKNEHGDNNIASIYYGEGDFKL